MVIRSIWRQLGVSEIKMVQRQIEALVICGPSGSGKSTLLKQLFKDFPDKFGYSVSHTTRLPRQGEVHGVHYYFTEPSEMKEAIKRGEFVESAEYSGHLYGTGKKAIEDVVKEGKICVLDIDVQGVKQIKQSSINAVYVFIRPPSLDILSERLQRRGTESEISLSKRLAAAKAELEYGENPSNFDLILTNDYLEKAYEILKSFVTKNILKIPATGTGASDCTFEVRNG